MNNNLIIEKNNFLSTYADKNRTKIDEALVSLRFMKQIDTFLDLNNLNQKELANDLDTSPAFISQLMSGTKKINTSFINKFEKKYNIEFKVLIQSNDSEYRIIECVQSSIEIKLNISAFVENKNSYSFQNNSENLFEFHSNFNQIFRLK
jgi:transcriptional regulator with XRE-family HTH domain